MRRGFASKLASPRGREDWSKKLYKQAAFWGTAVGEPSTSKSSNVTGTSSMTFRPSYKRYSAGRISRAAASFKALKPKTWRTRGPHHCLRGSAALGYRASAQRSQRGLLGRSIHHKLAGTIARLVRDGADGNAFAGLRSNKYGNRAGAVDKRFGRMKTALGYGEQYVFHSIRKTVDTLMENAGITDGIAADILGHEKTP